MKKINKKHLTILGCIVGLAIVVMVGNKMFNNSSRYPTANDEISSEELDSSPYSDDKGPDASSGQ